jgi:glycosyltransferase involved in cell wall biosynthesis
MKRDTSVIIPSYNNAVFLPEAIESALSQSVPPLEVIVVDDGSTDNTRDIIEPYRRSIRYFFQENKGLAGARNRGIEEARGNLVAFLDADDIWLPEKLERQHECMAQNPKLCLIHSDLWYWDLRSGQKYRRDCGRQEFRGSCYERFFLRNRVLPSTTVIRRECLRKVGAFDEVLRRCEDYDLWFRVAKHYELGYVDEPLVLYRLHQSSLTKNTLAMLESELFVVRKRLQEDPELARTIGSTTVNERMFGLLFAIGYDYHDRQISSEARRYFFQALLHRPTRAYVWLLYLANQFPPAWMRVFRELKQSVTLIAQQKC